MELSDLQMLVSIAEEGSLSAAARARGVSQPAVSKRVQRFEAELGLALLERGPRQAARLTAAGERVVSFARETLARYEAMERELAALKAVGPGVLAVAASTIPGEYLLPGLLAEFRAEVPDVQVQVTIGDSAEVVDKVMSGKADVGLLGTAVRRPGLHTEPLVGDKIVLAVPPDHPFAGRERVSAEELRGQPLIWREAGSGTRKSLEEALAAAGIRLPQPRGSLVLGSTQAVLRAVEQGLGMGFVSARAAAQAQADGHLACLRLAGVDLKRDLILATLTSRAGDPLVARFVAFAHERLGVMHEEPSRAPVGR